MWFSKRKSNPCLEESSTRLDAEFDLERVDVISIERLDGQTVLGYYTESDKETIQEWNLNCTEDKHLNLVHRLREKLQRQRDSALKP